MKSARRHMGQRALSQSAHGHTRIVAAALLALHCVTPMAADKPLLSSTNAGYAFVEKIQQQYCTKRPSHACTTDESVCRTTAAKLWKELFKEDAAPEYLDRQCSRVSTKFEMPGMYVFLNEQFTEVRDVAATVNLPQLDRVHVGSLPIRDINARVLPPDSDLGHFLFFNVRFIEFASELAKISAIAIPQEIRVNNIVFDGNLEVLERRVASNPEILFLFVNRLMYFLDVESLKPHPPPEDIRPILSSYQQGIELFAMGHEYSHLGLRHSGAAIQLEGADISAADLQIAGASGNWIQELDADYHGALILAEIARRRTIGSDRHPAEFILLTTPRFYFLARRIVRDAESLFFGTAEVGMPTAVESDLLKLATACVRKPDCKLPQALGGRTDVPNGHPHPIIREAFIEAVLSREPVNETEAAMRKLSDLVYGNAHYLWTNIGNKLRQPEAKELIESVKKAREKRLKG